MGSQFRPMFFSLMNGLVLSVLLTLKTEGVAREPDYDPERFEVTLITSGLKRPMELAVAKDGTVFFIELDGHLKAIDPTSKQILTVGHVSVTTEQENGLIGLALDPNFSTNGWIYLQYSPPDFTGQFISRFTLVNGKIDPTTEKVILKYEEQRKECCHHAGSLSFGPNGDLFIATGDNTHPHGDSGGYAPLDERSDRAPWDAQKSSANTRSYNGKILRIRPTSDGVAEIPEGNLFPRDGSHGAPEIYVMGCRNPWRISVDSKNGFVYWGDVGPDAGNDGPRGPRGYDEVNQARAAGNFGWPYFIANNQPYADVDFATGTVGEKYDPLKPVNVSPNNTGIPQLPPAQPAFLYYPYGESKEFPELGQGGRTACAGPVFYYSDSLNSTTKFPKELDRSLLVYEWSRHWIKLVRLDDEYRVKSIEPFMGGAKFVRPIDMEFGPEGSLYLIEYGETWGENKDARLVRVDYVRGNRAPEAVASAKNNIGKEPLVVEFSSLGTRDKDKEDVLRYEWRVRKTSADPNAASNPLEPADAGNLISTDANPTITFDQPGIYNVELVAVDSLGSVGSSSVAVLVGNSRPVLKFLAPRDGDFFDEAEAVRYELYVNDTEDGTNDFDEAEAKGLPEIDAVSPRRVSVNATFVSSAIPKSASEFKVDEGPAGMRMMKRSDCFNCHAVDQKRVGPSFLDIATKYRGRDDAFELSVQRVMKGSSGVWGKVPMVPHGHHTAEEVREMVGWVFGLQANSLTRVYEGFVNEIPITANEMAQPGHLRLDATYVDRGTNAAPPLSGMATVSLRQRQLEAEWADLIQGPKIMGGKKSRGKYVGEIDHGDHLQFDGIAFDTVKQLNIRLTSAGAGGSIEVRLDQPDGPLIASSKVEVNGHWDQWYELPIPIPPTQGRHNVVLRFVHPEQATGLMSVDSVHFLAELPPSNSKVGSIRDEKPQ